jgi:hypothetical protein
MKRRDFLRYIGALPFVGALLSKLAEAKSVTGTPLQARMITREDMLSYKPKHSDIWRIQQDGVGESQGGAIRFYRLFLRMDYNVPRAHKFHYLFGRWEPGSDYTEYRLFDEFTELFNNERAENPVFVPTGIAKPTGKLSELVLTVEVAKKTRSRQIDFGHGHVLDFGNGFTDTQKCVCAPEGKPADMYLHQSSFAEILRRRGIDVLHVESWGLPYVHGYRVPEKEGDEPTGHTVLQTTEKLIDFLSRWNSSEWYEARSWGSVAMHNPTARYTGCFEMTTENVFAPQFPLWKGEV